MALDPLEFSRLVADRVRLATLGLLALEARTAKELAGEVGISEREALRVLGRLAASGLVTAREGEYRIDLEALRAFAADLTPSEPADPDMFKNLTTEESEMASRFFRGRRLTEIPMSRPKRLAVLRRIVQEFEPGRRFTEAHINMTLGLFHPDWASLRRYLVDEGLLDRDPSSGMYWRSGGPVQVDHEAGDT